MNRAQSPLHLAVLLVALQSVVAPTAFGAAGATPFTATKEPNLGTALPDSVGDVPGVNLSFSDAMTLLKERNQRLQAAVETERQSAELQAAARGLRLPRLQVSAQWTRIDEPIAIDLEPIRGAMLALHPTVPEEAVPPFVADIQDDRFFKAQMEMTWPVYAGGKITAANRAADARLEDARQQGRSTEQALLAELVDRYYGLRLAEQARAVRQQVLDGMDKHLFQATRLEEEGLIAHAERLHAEVARAEAARALQAADHDVALASTALRTLLASDCELRPTANLFIVHSLPPLDELQRKALEDNPNLHRLAAQRVLARQAVAVERAAYKPDVALFAVRELATADLTILEPSWAAGVGVKLNVFDGFARGHRMAAARAAESSVAHFEEGARHDVALLVEDRYHRLRKAIEQFDSISATIILAEENLRVRTLAFEEGFATSLDVVDARSTLAGVRLARLSAAYDFLSVLGDLLAATGHGEHFENYRLMADVEVTS